ncbi:MAG TPA: TlpA disulfide reductase family protein [bacterium]|nr:TlpA disulfide reductase family protein [bacterium]
MKLRARELKAVGALALAVCLCGGCPAKFDSQGVSKLDTSAVFLDLEGNKVSLSEFSAGAPMLVTFFASWCSVCATEVPEINRIYSEYEDEGLAVFGVNVGDPPGARDKFLSNNGVEYPILHDPDGSTAHKIAKLYGLPLNILADADGNVIYYDPAPPPDAVIQNILKNHYKR